MVEEAKSDREALMAMAKVWTVLILQQRLCINARLPGDQNLILLADPRWMPRCMKEPRLRQMRDTLAEDTPACDGTLLWESAGRIE